MDYNVLILGASYGSLLGTKLLMAGHNVSLVCRSETAKLINAEGTVVRIQLRGEDKHRSIRSEDQPRRLVAVTPEEVNPSAYDLIGLAMQEPQYGAQSIQRLMHQIAEAHVPCLSIMNMPPLPYLKRIPGLDTEKLEASFAHPRVWDGFDPNFMTLCSPDPQAFRPPEEKPNVLHVGLPTNFKAAAFDNAASNKILAKLETDIDAIRLDGQDVPVKLRIFDSLFVPLAKWSMLLTGNYRCITHDDARTIRDAVHSDLTESENTYAYVDALAQRLGANPTDQVPFQKYATAAKGLLNPSSAARAISAGATNIERVDKLVQLIGDELGLSNKTVAETVATVDARLAENQSRVD